MFQNIKVKLTIILFFVLILVASNSCSSNPTSGNSSTSNRDVSSTRTPGEWEEQAAIWMQWPNDWEASLRPSFVKIIAVVQQYETVKLFVRSEAMKANAIQMFQQQNIPLTNVSFHIAEYDNAWLRDNGPVYVFDKNSKWVLDFKFDGWGSSFGGDVEYKNDDKIPE